MGYGVCERIKLFIFRHQPLLLSIIGNMPVKPNGKRICLLRQANIVGGAHAEGALFLLAAWLLGEKDEGNVAGFGLPTELLANGRFLCWQWQIKKHQLRQRCLTNGFREGGFRFQPQDEKPGRL